MAKTARPNISSETSEAIDTTLDLALEILEATKDTIVDALSAPGIGVALNAAIALLKKVQDTKSNRAALESLREETKSLAQTLVRLGKIVQTALHEYPAGSEEYKRTREAIGFANLAERTNQLASDLQAICAEAEKLIKRDRFRGFIHSKGDARTIADMKERIETAHRHFQIEGGVTTEAKVTAALSDIKRVIAEQKVAEEERILNSIPRVDEAHYLSAANTTKARLQEGTREPVFARLEEWEDGQFAEGGAPPILVLTGEAGTGKSTIASEYSKRLQARKRYGASYFFTRGVQDLNSPWKFFSTIASQLARSQPALRVPVVEAAREHLKTATLQQLELEFEDLLRKPLGTLPSSHPPIFVIVDALDECTEEGPELVPSLVRLLLSAAVRPGSPLRVFLTSRPEPHYIHKVFTTSDMQPHVFIISIQDFRSSVDRDIDHFIRARLAENETSKKWSSMNPETVINLVKKSDGLFVYARTAIEFVLDDVDDPISMQERYDLLLTGNGTFGIVALDTLYRTVLESVFPPRDPHLQRQERLKRILGYLATLLEPKGISPRTLERLTNMPTAESVPILNKLRSVIIFERDNVDSPFRIIHASFREFLVAPSRTSEAFHFSAEQIQRGHRLLVQDCMRMMRLLMANHLQRFTRVALLHHLLSNALPEVREPHFTYVTKHFEQHLEHQSTNSRHDLENRSIGDDDVLATLSILGRLSPREMSGFWLGKNPMFPCVIDVLTHTRATMSTAAVSEVRAIGGALDIAIELLKTLQIRKHGSVERVVQICLQVTSCSDTLEQMSNIVDAVLHNHPARYSERTPANEEATGSFTLLERVEKLTRDLQEISAMAERVPKRGSRLSASIFHSATIKQALCDITDKIALAHRGFHIGICTITEEEASEL